MFSIGPGAGAVLVGAVFVATVLVMESGVGSVEPGAVLVGAVFVAGPQATTIESTTTDTGNRHISVQTSRQPRRFAPEVVHVGKPTLPSRTTAGSLSAREVR